MRNKAKETIYDLVLSALMTDGEHHKQWYLERILEELGHNPKVIKDLSWDEGVAP